MAGGNFSAPLSPSLWNTEQWQARFYRGQMDPQKPFSSMIDRTAPWIFMERASLGRLIDRLKAPERSTAGGMKRCQTWLEEQMRASLPKRPKPKREFLLEAKNKFGVWERSFNAAWKNALSETGAQWGKAGAPKRRT
jgi:hypothetical protein